MNSSTDQGTLAHRSFLLLLFFLLCDNQKEREREKTEYSTKLVGGLCFLQLLERNEVTKMNISLSLSFFFTWRSDTMICRFPYYQTVAHIHTKRRNTDRPVRERGEEKKKCSTFQTENFVRIKHDT